MTNTQISRTLQRVRIERGLKKHQIYQGIDMSRIVYFHIEKGDKYILASELIELLSYHEMTLQEFKDFAKERGII